MLNRQTPSKPRTRGEVDHFFHDPDYITLSDIMSFVRRHFFTIAAGLFLGALLAAVYVTRATPLFTARAQLLIDPNTSQVLQDRRTEVTLDAAHIQNQIEVIESDTIAVDVVQKLKLTEDPEFQDKTGTPNLSEYEKIRTAVAALHSSLDVRRAGVSHVIDISVTTTDPEKSARIANAIAKAYEKAEVAARAEAARQSSEWLESRIHKLRAKLDEAALALQSFKSGRGYPSASEADADKIPTTVAALEATVEAYRKIYEGYYQAFTNSVEQQSYPVAGARVITPAAPPLVKSHPRSKLILAFGTFAGLLIGVGVAFLRHVMDGSARTPKQIRERMGLECIARIPRLTPSRSLLQRLRLTPWHHSPKDEARARFNHVADNPFSQFSGAVKALKTAVIKAGGQEGIHTLGITSALPQEGKSTLIANLASVFAVASYKTLIIDADLHNSVISQTLAPHAKRGVIEALCGAAEPARCIVSGKAGNPDVMPVVLPKQAAVSYDLLGSQNMLDLLNHLRESYHIILVDMPPLTPVADGITLSGLLDGVVVAVEWGSTPLDLLTEVAYGLHLADTNVLGVVLTKVDESAVHLRLKKSWKYY